MVYNLEDVWSSSLQPPSFDVMRETFVENYSKSAEAIRRKLMSSEEGLHLYRAITRFMFEDGMTPDFRGSLTSLQKDSKARALSVIQRSWAWGTLLEERFPDAIRLSIHPQPPSGPKLGIHMLSTRDSWLTPWHSVAVKRGDGFVLMKKKDAEMNGGHIIKIKQNPDYYQLDSPGDNTLEEHQ